MEYDFYLVFYVKVVGNGVNEGCITEGDYLIRLKETDNICSIYDSIISYY